MTSRLRVAIALPNFERLGAQRVAFWIAEGLDRSRFDPFFLVHEATGELAAQAPEDVPVVEVDRYLPRLSRGRSITRLRGYARALREHVPDVALGVVQYPTLALAAARAQLRAQWKIVACEHSFVTKNLADVEAYGPVFRAVYRAALRPTYNRVVDRVLMTAEEGRDDLVDNFGVERSHIVVVPNPVDGARVRAQGEAPLDDPWLPRDPMRETRVPVVVGAGRFVAQKRFDHLVRAFAIARSRRPARLILLGNGPAHADLQALARSLGVADDVRFLDVSPPWAHMRRASIFALSSEWEGFPMVLAEAMALGCPIVSYACPSGPREMLADGAAGVLVPSSDVEALGAAIAAAFDHPERMEPLALHARERSRAYEKREVVSRYESLFLELCGRSR